MFARKLKRFFSQITDPWKILNVSRAASEKDIKKAYINLVKLHHPDRAQDDGEMFKKVQEAYKILIDPKEKKKFFSQKR